MKTIFYMLILSTAALSQQFSVSGIVKDSSTNAPLAFANIRVLGSYSGIASNKQGNYEIKLKPGKYSLTASYLGYFSDTVNITVDGNKRNINFLLAPARVELQEITVRPGENPAIPIIKKAIERKKQRNSLISSYEQTAYTKGVIRTDQEISAKRRGMDLTIGDSDSSELFISGIIENQSKGYFKKPDLFKEFITARKQTSNLPSSINVLTGGRFIQNFYDEDINFLSTNLPGPIADDAIEYYYYHLEATDAINNTPVYKIHISPEKTYDPGFTGYIYITDSTYDLVRVDLQLNRAANIGGIFDTINVFQQFSRYDGIFMPGDYRLYATANVLNLARFGFELSTTLYDYKINENIPDEIFSKAVVTVDPDADYKDSLYWDDTQTIPGTSDEIAAYKRIDSLSRIPVTFWDNFSFLSTQISFNDNFSINGPLSLYHFNSVEGHSIDLGLYADDLIRERLSSAFLFSYGFADDRFKTDFSAEYLFGKYRTGSIKGNVFNRTNELFGESVGYNELTSTLLSLLAKYEFRDYYYSRGAGFSISDEVFPILELSLGYDYRRDLSAVKNTEYSFFAKDELYKDNQAVNDFEINYLSAGFQFDFRDYIEDGLYRRRISQGGSYVLLGGTFKFSNNDYLRTTNDFFQFNFNIDGTLRSFRSTIFNYSLVGLHTTGNVPYQMLYSIPGNIDYTAVPGSFRTLQVSQVTGDRIYTANIEYNFRDELFKMLNVPFFKYAEIQLKVFLNAALAKTISSSSRQLDVEIQEFLHPFYETGFSIGHVLIPLELSFAWKLNYRGENNFRFGIGSVIY